MNLIQGRGGREGREGREGRGGRGEEGRREGAEFYLRIYFN